MPRGPSSSITISGRVVPRKSPGRARSNSPRPPATLRISPTTRPVRPPATAPYGSIISAVIDIGTISATIVGKTDRNDPVLYSGDLRFGDNSGNGGFIGSGSLQFRGLSFAAETNTSYGLHSMHFVLNANDSAFTGGILIDNCDVSIGKSNALSAANSVTFDTIFVSGGGSLLIPNRGGLFLFGHDLTIGSLNDTSESGTTSVIRNAANTQANGGTNVLLLRPGRWASAPRPIAH